MRGALRPGVIAAVAVLLAACPPPPPYSAKRLVEDRAVAEDKCNCAGYCFAGGKSFIEECEGKKTLAKSFTKVEKAKAKVCDVIAYDDADTPSHFVIVVEVGEKGATRTIGKMGQAGKEVWLTPPDDAFAKPSDTWSPYTRNEPNKTVQADVDKAAAAASKAESTYKDSGKDDDRTAADAAWLKLVELCRKRNKV